jgi:hypothetical protein
MRTVKLDNSKGELGAKFPGWVKSREGWISIFRKLFSAEQIKDQKSVDLHIVETRVLKGKHSRNVLFRSQNGKEYADTCSLKLLQRKP